MQSDLSPITVSYVLNAPEETSALAARLARILRARDVILLSGPIGAGKTHFCRALIKALLAETGRDEDVPSPSFTLVQTYLAGALEIWHADLYRLTHPDEVYELGLEEAFTSALCLIEWPERLDGDVPDQALTLKFALDDAANTRLLTIEGDAAGWADRLKPLELDSHNNE